MGKTKEMCVLGWKTKLVTLPDAVDERMFLLSDLGFQKFKIRFSGLIVE